MNDEVFFLSFFREHVDGWEVYHFDDVFKSLDAVANCINTWGRGRTPKLEPSLNGYGEWSEKDEDGYIWTVKRWSVDTVLEEVGRQ